jgi:hypothetical protein
VKLNESMIKSPMPTAKISRAAVRMRRHCQRRREGLRSLTIEVREAEIDGLIESGFLDGGSRNDVNAVTQALYRLLDRIFRVTRNAPRTW